MAWGGWDDPFARATRGLRRMGRVAWPSSCSRNAHDRNVLVRRAQSRIDQATLENEMGNWEDARSWGRPNCLSEGSLAAALLDGLFEHPGQHKCVSSEEPSIVAGPRPITDECAHCAGQQSRGGSLRSYPAESLPHRMCGLPWRRDQDPRGRASGRWRSQRRIDPVLSQPTLDSFQFGADPIRRERQAQTCFAERGHLATGAGSLELGAAKIVRGCGMSEEAGKKGCAGVYFESVSDGRGVASVALCLSARPLSGVGSVTRP